jgi:hypothetical protein
MISQGPCSGSQSESQKAAVGLAMRTAFSLSGLMASLMLSLTGGFLAPQTLAESFHCQSLKMILVLSHQNP